VYYSTLDNTCEFADCIKFNLTHRLSPALHALVPFIALRILTVGWLNVKQSAHTVILFLNGDCQDYKYI
jgi:hypothetical protein